MITRLGLVGMRLMALLPLPVLRALGAGLGWLLYWLAAERRAVAEINFAKCFPDLPAVERDGLIRAAFRSFAQAFLDRALLWHAPAERIRALVTLHGQAHLDRMAGRPVILLAPHFVGLDAAWAALTLDRRMLSIYARQKNRLFDAALRDGRMRFNNPALLSRQDGVRAALRELANGLPFYYLPDMDFGPRDAVFVPFFGIPAATVTAVSRLARLAGASVLPVVTRMTAAGYEVTIEAPWEAFPGESDTEDARRMNAWIETKVRENVAQYHWLHKRFKTRPPGEARFY